MRLLACAVARARAARLAAAATMAALVATGCSVERLWEPSRDRVLQRILPSAVQVVLEQQEGRRVRSGSGVAIAARSVRGGTECFVLTAGHTLTGAEGKREVYVLFDRHRGAGSRTRAAIVAQRNTSTVDLAVLRAESGDCVPARPGGRVALGESIWVVAFPWGRQMTLTSGIVSQVRLANDHSDGDAATHLMVDALVGYGSSGGGVYEARTGRLVGVVEGYNTARVTATAGGTPWYIDVPMPGQTFVTPLTDIQRFLADVGHAELFAGDAG